MSVLDVHHTGLYFSWLLNHKMHSFTWRK